jgi:hypothetical protein
LATEKNLCRQNPAHPTIERATYHPAHASPHRGAHEPVDLAVQPDVKASLRGGVGTSAQASQLTPLRPPPSFAPSASVASAVFALQLDRRGPACCISAQRAQDGARTWEKDTKTQDRVINR